jgi:hypothetical protein
MVKGRSSVVGFRHKDTGVLYCLDVGISVDPEVKKLPRGSVKTLRVIEGLPSYREQASAGGTGAGPAAKEPAGATVTPRRILGLAPVEEDGSFHVRVPAHTPITFQLLDEHGVSVASQYSWSWVMPGASRGCIGCHEDREMAPPNRLVQAIAKPEVKLTLSPERRRTVDFKNEIAPIIWARCAGCHAPGGAAPKLVDGADSYRTLCLGAERYVVPGEARNSLLLRHLFPHILSASAEEVRQSGPLSPCGQSLIRAERMLFIEWIDLGAHYHIRAAVNLSDRMRQRGGKGK